MVVDDQEPAPQDPTDTQAMKTRAHRRITSPLVTERAIAWLEERALLLDTILLLSADHGEEFYEREFLARGNCLYNEVIRVPLILVAPGEQIGYRVDRGARSLIVDRRMRRPPVLLYDWEDNETQSRNLAGNRTGVVRRLRGLYGSARRRFRAERLTLSSSRKRCERGCAPSATHGSEVACPSHGLRFFCVAAGMPASSFASNARRFTSRLDRAAVSARSIAWSRAFKASSGRRVAISASARSAQASARSG